MNVKSIILVLLCTTFTSTGQILWKLGAPGLVLNLSLLTNYPLIAGFMSYGVGAVLLMFALRSGEMTIVYPLVATSYIWVSLLSMKILGEQMSSLKWTGIAVIFIGVLFIQVQGVKNGN